MTKNDLLAWVLAGALGLGLGFLAALAPAILDHANTGIASPPGDSVSEFLITLVGWLVAGTILGVAQAVVMRSRGVSIARWILATVAGFGVGAVTLDWPLQAIGLLGRIPGPVEPIIFTHGGGILAGLFQYLVLRREAVSAGKWLGFWIAGLVVSLVPAAIFFIAIVESLDITLSWAAEVFITGFIVGGIAALVSAKSLFTALSERPEISARP